MQPILNYTPQVYEAILAGFASVAFLSLIALVRKSRQVGRLKEVIVDIVDTATKGVAQATINGVTLVAKANAKTRAVTESTDQALQKAEVVLTAASERIAELEGRIRELDDENSRLDVLEQRISELEADTEAGEETNGSPTLGDLIPSSVFGPFADSFRAANPIFAPLDLLSAIGRNASRPSPDLGRSIDDDSNGAPEIKAFYVTPTGRFVPVESPEDFLRSGGAFNRETPGDRKQPSLRDILSLLSSITPPRPKPGQWAGPQPGEDLTETKVGNTKADLDPYQALADSILADTARARSAGSVREAEACDTQRAPEAPQATAPVAGGGESPANDPGARAASRLDAQSQPYRKPEFRECDPTGFPGYGSPSPRAG